MKKYQEKGKIFVPVDYSEGSYKAIDYAIQLASQLKEADLYLFHTYFSTTMAFIEITDANFTQTQVHEEVLSSTKENEEKLFQELTDKVKEKIRAQNHKNIKLDYSIEPGVTDDTILKAINDYVPDIVIMGSKGMGKKNKGFLGSVTENIINRAKVPVLAIPKEYLTSDISKVKNILYITQFDESDFMSIKKLINLTNILNLKIFCLHITQEKPSAWERIKMDGLKGYFKTVYDKVAVECGLMESNNIIEDLNSYIKANNIQVISITSIKRKFLEKILKPNLNKKLFHHATLPLLVFHG